MNEEKVLKQRDLSRKMVYIALLFAPILYVVISLILIEGTGKVFSDYQDPFVVLLVAVAISEFISLIYIINNWQLKETENITEKMTQDIIKLALIQPIAMLGLVYFLVYLFN